MALQEHWLDTNCITGYTISAIPVTLIDVLWDKVKPLLMMPVNLSHGEIDIANVYERLKNGDALLLTVSKGREIIAVVTLEVREFESGLRTLHMPLVGGTDMKNWMERCIEISKAIAKDFNCTELRGTAVRKGWLRVLRDKGWEEVATIVKCPIGE